MGLPPTELRRSISHLRGTALPEIDLEQAIVSGIDFAVTIDVGWPAIDRPVVEPQDVVIKEVDDIVPVEIAATQIGIRSA